MSFLKGLSGLTLVTALLTGVAFRYTLTFDWLPLDLKILGIALLFLSVLVLLINDFVSELEKEKLKF